MPQLLHPDDVRGRGFYVLHRFGRGGVGATRLRDRAPGVDETRQQNPAPWGHYPVYQTTERTRPPKRRIQAIHVHMVCFDWFKSQVQTGRGGTLVHRCTNAVLIGDLMTSQAALKTTAPSSGVDRVRGPCQCSGLHTAIFNTSKMPRWCSVFSLHSDLLRMVQEAQVLEDVWGLLVAARKAYPRVFATGLKSRRLRTVARAALDEAQKMDGWGDADTITRAARRKVLEQEGRDLLQNKKEKKGPKRTSKRPPKRRRT